MFIKEVYFHPKDTKYAPLNYYFYSLNDYWTISKVSIILSTSTPPKLVFLPSR